MAISKVKISELPLEGTLKGLHTIGVNSTNESVKVSLEFVETAANKANTAAGNADAKREEIEANEAQRQSAEKARASAEKTRETAEAAREKASAAAVKKATEAAALANEKAGAADNAAGRANEAITQANTARDNANEAAKSTDAATKEAGKKVEEMNVLIARFEELVQSMNEDDHQRPKTLTVEYPERITRGNTDTDALRVRATLLPVGTGDNVLFLGDDNAVSVFPDGFLTVNRAGVSRIHVIPTENTSIYKTILITVTEPALRLVKAGSLRLAGNKNIIRLT